MNKSAHAFQILAHRDFSYSLVSRFLAEFGLMMVSVAVGWQVYDLTRQPMALGIVGLMQFAPAFIMTLPGGLASDRFDRKNVLLFGYVLEMIVAATLFALTVTHHLHVGLIYAVLTLVGVGRAFIAPASQSLVPFLVPQKDFVSAVAWASSSFQAAAIAGPAAGGLLYGLGPAYVYGVSLACFVVAGILIACLKIQLKIHNPSAAGLSGLFSGVRFVLERKIILGAVSLDLFAVLFGGATALLPVYASDILRTGPWGLGILRSAPALGAGLMALWIAHRPIRRRAGLKLFICVALFGLATIAFGVSRSFWGSLGLLVVLGASDMVSVVIRQTLVQINTPDEMRGRVSAVNMLFIGASNELGEFESGVTAAWFGVVRSVVIGGLGTLAVVGLWSWLFPDLRRMHDLDPKA